MRDLYETPAEALERLGEIPHAPAGADGNLAKGLALVFIMGGILAVGVVVAWTISNWAQATYYSQF